MARWLDAHTHLDSDELFPQKQEVLDRAQDAGVDQLLLVNSESTESSFHRTLECLEFHHPVKRFASFGVHPHHASKYDSEIEKRLNELFQHPNVIGFGEIGLDFFYNFSPQEVQIEVFRKQLLFARKVNLPVVIHCRDAYGKLAEILREISNEWRGMIHCFTGTTQEMEPLLKLGFYISFSGIVTFRKANALQDAAKAVALDHVLIETDAPFLAPVPFRGKTNEPAYVVHTGKFIASLKQIADDHFSDAVRENFTRLFKT
jgi:TatD DNase family protein